MPSRAAVHLETRTFACMRILIPPLKLVSLSLPLPTHLNNPSDHSRDVPLPRKRLEEANAPQVEIRFSSIPPFHHVRPIPSLAHVTP